MESTSVWTLVCAGTKIVSLPSVNSPWNATFRAHHTWSGWDETRPTLQRVPPPRKPCTPGQWIAVAKSTDAIVATTSPHTGGIKQQTAIWSVDNTSLEDLRRPSSPARRKLRRWSACYATAGTPARQESSFGRSQSLHNHSTLASTSAEIRLLRHRIDQRKSRYTHLHGICYTRQRHHNPPTTWGTPALQLHNTYTARWARPKPGTYTYMIVQGQFTTS